MRLGVAPGCTRGHFSLLRRNASTQKSIGAGKGRPRAAITVRKHFGPATQALKDKEVPAPVAQMDRAAVS
jgi:hypothetical protein